MQSRGVVIIGGGIGGLCAAIALRQAGLEVAVYERAEAYRPLGAGLSLWPNAMRAFEALGLARKVASAGASWRETVMHRWDGKVLSRLAVEALCREMGQPTVGLLRAELQQVLLRALGPGVVHLGAACTGFHVEGEKVRVTFADGQQARGDCLIGADGLHSVVRQQLFPEVRPRYGGRTSWRGVVNVASEVIPEGSQFELYGPGARFGISHMGRSPEGTWRTLRTYETRRRPRTTYVSKLSLQAGSLRYLRNPVARWGRDLLMQALPSSVALNQLRRVVGYDFLT